MRTLKLLVFASAVSLLFIVGYWIIVRPGGDNSVVGQSGNLREMCVGRIYAYGDSIAQYGWSDEYLTAVQVLIEGHRGDLSEEEHLQLMSTMQSCFVNKLDSLIRSCYGQSMKSGNFNDNKRLLQGYLGIEKLGYEYPAIKTSAHWQSVMDLKKVHRDIFGFNQRNHKLPARVKACLEWNGNRPQLRYSAPSNYNSYRLTMMNTLTGLSTRRNEIPELKKSPWTSQALNKESLVKKLNDGERIYKQNESAAVASFANVLMSQLHGHFDAGNRLGESEAKNFCQELSNLQKDLSKNGISCPELAKVKDQITRIYITHR